MRTKILPADKRSTFVRNYRRCLNAVKELLTSAILLKRFLRPRSWNIYFSGRVVLFFLKKKKKATTSGWFRRRERDYFLGSMRMVCMGVASWFKGAGRIPMTTVGLADKSTWCAAHRYHREMRFQITWKVTILINDPRTHSLLKLPLSWAHASVHWKRVL